MNCRIYAKWIQNYGHYVKSLAFIGSDCALNNGFKSLINNISKIRQSNFPFYFRRAENIFLNH